MTPARLRTIEKLFHQALDCEPGQLRAFLDHRCAGDEGLRDKVEALLASHRHGERRIETSIAAVAANIVQNGETESLNGQTIGHYKILKRIDAGGMGEVYLASDLIVGRKAALKLLPAHFTSNTDRLKRFQQEARVVAGLNHPNILTVYEVGEARSRQYIASELVDGETLRQRLARGSIQLDDAVEIAIQIAGALAAAHCAGVVHRDVKPENIMLRPDGYVKVLDFGIAKLAESAFAEATAARQEPMTLVETNLGSILGTVSYMSPEQARGAPVDKRTDFWSLGVVLYEMVTRRAPFTGDTPAEVIAAILGKEPPPLGNYAVHAPGEFQEIVTKALRKDPAERYQSANEMLEELKGLRRKLELTAELERAAARHPWLRWTRSPAALALVLFIATLALALPFYWHRNLTTSSPPEKSIVVLPFENAVHDPDTEYLSDGLAEALINSLTELQQLKVIARSTAFRYKGKQVDPQGVGRELNVRTVLMGVVRQAGDRLNVQVDLVDAMTGAQLWGQEYERKLADVLAVKQALVREVTEKLRLKLTGEQQQRLTQHDTANPDAFQFYLRGRYYWNKRTADNLTKAMEQFRQAVDKDPNYALAYVGLGDSYVLLEVYAGTPASETLPKAKAFAERALQLDSSLAEAHTSLGYVYNGLWRWKEAEEEFKRAIELNPNYPTAHHWYSLCLLDVGRIDEAKAEIKRAHELDPLSLIIGTTVTYAYLAEGDAKFAGAQSKKVVELDPNFPRGHEYLGLAYLKEGRHSEAIAELHKAVELSGRERWPLRDLGYGYAISGKRAEALAVIKELVGKYEKGQALGQDLAAVYAGLADKDQAFAWLEKDFQTRSGLLGWTRWAPAFDSLRSDPRFTGLLRRMGLSASNIAAPEKSIAVLPFENLSRDPDNAFFTDGVQGEILGDLARIADLKVIGSTSVTQYKGGVARDLRKIGQQLGAAHVVEGNVQRAGNRVRVNARLVDARTNRHLWGQSYDRDLADVFAIQSEIAKAIANELQAKLSPSERSEIEHRPTSDMTAYELYLKGRSLWGKRGGDNIRQAIAFYEEAIARDPNYAAVYAGLAEAYALLPGYTATAPRETNPKAKAAALKALQLDETLAEAHTALAEVLLYGDLNMAASISEFQRAIALNPNYATAHHWYGGDPLSALGRSEEAIAEGKRAVELDPLSPIINADFGWILIQARHFDEAIAQLRKTLEIDPTFYYAHYRLGMAFQCKGDLSAAIAEYTRAQQLSDDMFVSVLLAAAKAQSGDRQPSVRMLTELEELSQHGYVRPYWRTLLYLSLGNRDEAIRWLDQSVADHEGADIAAIKVDPLLEPLHGDRRFEALVQKVVGPEHTNLATPEKSIAVLPFENLSRDPDNAFFADGVQHEILTRLSKIADLKVISRTSTQHYKSAPENLPEIARQLGVAHVLEGSVQKSRDTVRVNVQLIKAANDSHLWAETFDRKLTDIFSVESEVAKAIAEQLRAKLTGQEEHAIAAKPTDNPEAYNAYLRGLAYSLKTTTPANSLGAQKYLKEAVRLDPKFALSWALLSYIDARGYLGTLQPTLALREEARQAAETALTLQPNLGEAILAKGQYYYACLKDYETAVSYFEQARQFLPNSSRIPESLAYVARRRGQWDQSESYFNEAERVDPRNANLVAQHALSYGFLRRFPEALRKLDQVLSITPDDVDTLALKGAIAQAEGDLPRAAALLAPLHPAADDPEAFETQVYQAILERRPALVIPRLKEILAKPDPALGYFNGELRFWLGWAQEVAGDRAAAQVSWRQARNELESFLKNQPENGRIIGAVALTNAGLGNKAAAFAVTEQAMAVVPIEKDAVFGPIPLEILARVAAQMGEPDRAIATLEKLLSIPYAGPMREEVPLTPALLRLDPMFDPLRGDPRFQKLAASDKPEP